MIHLFPKDFIFEEPHEFTDPFRYMPHPAVREAARLVMQRIDSDAAAAADFSEGKMLGVLVCGPPLCYIAAFSGNVGGRSIIEGFVPPIYDLTSPDGEFRKREAEISALNRRIEEILGSEELTGLRNALTDAERNRDEEIGLMRARMAASKRERDRLRSECNDVSYLAVLVKESQFEKAELKRLKISWEERIAGIRSEIDETVSEAEDMKQRRASMSESLQEWIFRQYTVHNAIGEESTIAEIFSGVGLVPPGGAGECAAPKLLEYAYRNGLKPLVMGEFWYGKPSGTAVRNHGAFYPSCTNKCGPLLGFMTKGLHLDKATPPAQTMTPVILHEDRQIIVAEKPCGMPSVPGLDGRKSFLEWLQERPGAGAPTIEAVHRLDMDTSGVMILAKTSHAAADLRHQFEEHSVRKTYTARVFMTHNRTIPEKGTISLPLSPDYDERPRQKVDFGQGKPSYTEYETSGINPDGTMDLILHPVTGRTHQLRVHCAHSLGLGCPIIGDMLYGGENGTRLHLHALSITFRHPESGKDVTFTSSRTCY